MYIYIYKAIIMLRFLAAAEPLVDSNSTRTGQAAIGTLPV